LCSTGYLLAFSNDDPPSQDQDQYAYSHAECEFFGAKREQYAGMVRGVSRAPSRNATGLTARTNQVVAMLAKAPGGSRTYTFDQAPSPDSIDYYINEDFQAQGITPAPMTTDYEFIRRVTLDLTGRIPNPDRVLAFVADTTPGKRAQLVDELLAKPEWVDKWTMFFGDLLYVVASRQTSIGMQRYPQGRNLYYQWLRDSIAANRPYNEMVTEMLTASTSNHYEESAGAVQGMLNAYMSGGPTQDRMDQGTNFIFTTFLGMSQVNCVLCHNGRGHVDAFNLWAGQTTRYQAWQLASFLSRTQVAPIGDPNVPNRQYWVVRDNVTGFTLDYTLNSAAGNRPARVAPSGCRSGQPCYYVAPRYIFNDEAPAPGESYRAALARMITGDIQFARATVNYLWAHLFGRGIVDPPDVFDPARLDPDNPPPTPWTLQPSNARLLNALARHYVENGYNLKAILREIVTSDTYQLSSRYEGTWNPEWEPYFARKFVRRLWAEEIHDAVVLSNGAIPSYDIGNFTTLGFPKPSFAMQFPDTVVGSDNNTIGFLNSFIRGNRDDLPRKSEGSIIQALNLMNNSIVVNRSRATGAQANQLIVQNLNKSNTELVNALFLGILSRPPSTDELSKALASIPAGGNARTAAIQDLTWSLYNKVDFIFNY
jgi:hypothetical protein